MRLHRTDDPGRLRAKGGRVRRIGLIAQLVALLVSLCVPVITAQTPIEVAGTSAAGTTVHQLPNPLAARPFYPDPRTWAAWAVLTNRSTAVDVGVLARTPQARWFGDWTPTSSVAQQVRSYIAAAADVKSMPVMVLYAIPFRDCGGFSAGGFSTSGQYASWIHQVVLGISARPVAVILEPDALAGEDCLGAAARTTRNAMLKNAVQQLSADAGTAVYIDGGHSRWLGAAELASRLTSVGVASVRGFSLNVSNFYRTDEEIAYGEAVSRLLGGAHYVVDTSRNGVGPAAASVLDWCNPTGRAVGTAPTSRTSGAHADGYLWIKHPGESDGECDRGDPVSGTWFNSYAVSLVQRARKAGVALR